MAAAAGNSRFAVTCGLLRQFMREQQTGGLAPASLLLPLLEAAAEEADARTMQLFPTRAGASRPSSERPEEVQAVAPLTIFYEGRVLVFEDFPAEKARELMQLAGSGSSSPATQNRAPAMPEKPADAKPSAVLSDLPIARKASLQRFLQKRKHRISAAINPYGKETALPGPEKDFAAGEPVKDESAASWLAL